MACESEQEKHVSQLEDLKREIQTLRTERDSLQARLDGVLDRIGMTYDEVFNPQPTPMIKIP